MVTFFLSSVLSLSLMSKVSLGCVGLFIFMSEKLKMTVIFEWVVHLNG